MEQRILSNYNTFKFKDSFWTLDGAKQKKIISDFTTAISTCAEKTFFYQVFPARSEYDLFVWTTVKFEELNAADQYFKKFAKAFSPYRQYIDTPYILCGITKPSLYSKAKKSAQELDPYDDTNRKPYFVIYPFAKTTKWYLKSREERQELMNEHIKLGKSFPAITQLLLYSFGIQDQEFIVAYEMEDLPLFSDLVQQLRSTVARDYTLLDTPIITGVHRSKEELGDIFSV